MSFARKRILSIVLIIIIIVGVGTTTYFLFFKKSDPAMYIRRIGSEEASGLSASNFKESRLYIHKSGTFEIKVIKSEDVINETIFVGIGTYKKTKKSYIFSFQECYYRIGTELERGIDYIGEANAKTYPIDSKRIRFDFEGILYYFGK